MAEMTLLDRCALALKPFEDDMSNTILDGDFAELRRKMVLAVARVLLTEPASEGMEDAWATLPEDDDTNWRKVAGNDWRVLATQRLAELGSARG